MEKTIINYVSGGLGNILLPLCSCSVVSKKTDRKLIGCWEETPACMANYLDLFDGEMQIISKKDLLSFDNVKIYGDLYDINFDSVLYEENSFQQLTKKYTTLPIQNFHLDDSEKNVIAYYNNIIPTLDKNEVIEEFKKLKWNKNIISKVEKYKKEFNIDKNVFGINARATDFNNGIEIYINYVNEILKSNSNARFFVVSDSSDWEEIICNIFPDNVFRRLKSSYVTKKNENIVEWSNNVFRSKESVIESVIDAHLLSKTNFSIYNNHSSFAQMIKYLM